MKAIAACTTSSEVTASSKPRSSVRRPDRLAIQHQFRGGLRPNEARNALRAACSRKQPEGHLGSSETRPGRRYAVVPCHGELEAGSQAQSINRHDNGLREGLDQAHQRADRIEPLRILIKVCDIGARAKMTAAACNHNSPHGRGLLRSPQGGVQRRHHPVSNR